MDFVLGPWKAQPSAYPLGAPKEEQKSTEGCYPPWSDLQTLMADRKAPHWAWRSLSAAEMAEDSAMQRSREHCYGAMMAATKYSAAHSDQTKAATTKSGCR